MNFQNNNSKEKNCNDPECRLVRLGIKHKISEHRNFKPNSGFPDYFEPAFCNDLSCFKNKEGKNHFENECGKFIVNEGTKRQNCVVCFLTVFGVLSFVVSMALGIVFVSIVDGARFNEFFVQGRF
jgi:hypothetical protein